MITTKKDADFIWRIETGDGEGAYHGMCYGEGQYYGKCHPAPTGDGIEGFDKEHFFGFEDVLQARRWFTSVHDLADWERYHQAKLVVYEKSAVAKIIEGNSQIVFKPNGATPIKLHATDLHRLRVTELVEKVCGEFSRLLSTTA